MASRDDLTGLLSACARDDHRAFERLYILASPRLFAICRYMLRHEDVAEDVLQEAFIQIWRDAKNFDRRRASPMTWMAAITRHRALDRLRRKRPELALDEEPLIAPVMNEEAISTRLVGQQTAQCLHGYLVGPAKSLNCAGLFSRPHSPGAE